MLLINFMLSISIMRCSLDFSLGDRPHRFSPPDEGALTPCQGGSLSQGSDEVPDIPRALRGAVPAIAGRPESGRGDGGGSPLDLGLAGSSLLPSGGRYFAHSESGERLEHVLDLVHSGVGELFPANKITAHCSGCKCIIPRGEGYRHINIGRKKTYCMSCQVGQGLPLRKS
jgi:hypothetical protein